MNIDDLIRYLQGFDPSEIPRLIIVDPPRRKLYPVTEVVCITDNTFPVFGVEVGEAEPFDDELKTAAEDDEQKGGEE